MDEKAKKILSILLILVVTFSAISITFELNLLSIRNKTRTTVNPSISLGPKISVNFSSSQAKNSLELANNTTYAIQISSEVPDSKLNRNFTSPGNSMNGVNPDNNTHYDILLNESVNSSHDIMYLSASFNVIAHDWRTILSRYSGTSYPSLTLNAFKTVHVNSTITIFHYYNNIQYDPFKVNSTVLNSTMLNSTTARNYFNNSAINTSQYSSITVSSVSFKENIVFPSTPIQEISIPATASSVLYTPDCSNSVSYYNATAYDTYDTILWTNNTTGVLPLMGVHMGSGTDNSNSIVTYFANVLLQSNSLGLNSVQSYVDVTGQVTTTMSSTASYSHIANASYTGQGASNAVYPFKTGQNRSYNVSATNQTTGIVGIENATYLSTHFNRYTTEYREEYKKTIVFEYIDGTCIPHSSSTILIKKTAINTTYDGNGTTVEITDVSTINNLDIRANFYPIEVNRVLQHLLENNVTDNITFNSSQEYSSSTIFTHYYGYSTASSELETINNALATFSAGLSFGLTVMATLAALNGFDWDAGEPSIVTDVAGLVAGYTGLASYLTSTFTSISYISGSSAAYIDWGITNTLYPGHPTGSNYTISFFQNYNYITMNANGNMYSFNAPEDYINVTAVI